MSRAYLEVVCLICLKHFWKQASNKAFKLQLRLMWSEGGQHGQVSFEVSLSLALSLSVARSLSLARSLAHSLSLSRSLDFSLTLARSFVFADALSLSHSIKLYVHLAVCLREIEEKITHTT
jgi:hypothetical protein